MSAVEEIVRKVRQRQLEKDLRVELFRLENHQGNTKAFLEWRLLYLQEKWGLSQSELAARMNELLEVRNEQKKD